MNKEGALVNLYERQKVGAQNTKKVGEEGQRRLERQK